MSARALALAAALVASPLLLAGPARAGPARHSDVKGEQDCAACHRAGTPEVFRAWDRGRHGLALVKCIACHGSTGADFTRRAAAARCQGCHPAQVESFRRTGARDCFACHDPHGLAANPHRSAP